MKKIVALVLALSMMFALCACGGSSDSTGNPQMQNKESSVSDNNEGKNITPSEAKTIAQDEVKNCSYILADKASCSKITLLSFGDCSVTLNEKTEKYENGFYEITVRGHFYSVDSYGNTDSKYNFTWELIRIDAKTGEVLQSTFSAYAGYLSVTKA